MEIYYIYKFTNKNNNKSYIGQSIKPYKRYKEHLYGRKNKNNTYFDKIIRKNGIENFSFEIIDKANNQEEIDKLEQKYISQYNTIIPNGYNILKGGRNQKGSWNSKPINEYDLNVNFIATYESASYYSNFVNTEYERRMITRSCNEKKHYKDRIFRYVGDEKPEKYTKPKSSRCTPVYQFNLDGNLINEYSSIQEASEKTNSCRTTIIGCLNGKYKTANNYIWSREKIINIKETDKVIVKTIIYQCDKNKNIIKKFYNTRQAEKYNNFKYNSYKQILKYLDTNKLYQGFYWYRVKFYEDNIVPSLNEN